MAKFAVQGIMKGINIYLSLGSNLGDREKFLNEACVAIDSDAGNVMARSMIYETLAWGKTDQPNFLNQVIEIKSNYKPESLFHILQQIERRFGRKRTVLWGPRTLDIDILFYGNEIIRSKSLVIPHPEVVNRIFVLMPMNDIAPNYFHPSENQSIAKLLQNIPNKGQIWPYKNDEKR